MAVTAHGAILTPIGQHTILKKRALLIPRFYGTCMKLIKVNKTNTDRFLKFVKYAENGCWLWQGASCKGSVARYGNFSIGGKGLNAHRYAYSAFIGPIKSKMQIDHVCRQTLCVNPLHLEQVSAKENTLRGIGPTAQNSRKTFCPHGHPYSGRNLIINSKGARTCRVCKNRDWRNWKAKKKAILWRPEPISEDEK